MEFPPEPLLFKRLLLIVVLLASTAAAELILSPDQWDAEKDGSFTWRFRGAPTGDVNYTWYRGNESLEVNMLISYINSSQSRIPGPRNTGRENVTDKGYLRITELELNDSGIYMLVVASPGERQEATGELQVWDRMLKPSITVNKASVQAYMDEVTFTCHPNNTGDFQIQWYGISEFESQQWKLSSDNRILTGWVSQYQRGPFRCVVSNLVSWESSDSVWLDVYYGPDSILKTSLPASHVDTVESPLGWRVNLQCSTTSEPPCLYRWYLNGTSLPTTTNSWSINSMSWEHVGTYRCTAENPKTQVLLYTNFDLKVSKTSIVQQPRYTLYQGTVIFLSIGISLGLLYLIGGLIFYLASKR